MPHALDILSQSTILDNLAKINRYQLTADNTSTQLLLLMNKLFNDIRTYQLKTLNNKLGVDPLVKLGGKIHLSKREGEILYYLSLYKQPKEIAGIISTLENKIIASATVGSIISKQLYVKFKVGSISKLIEKASLLGMIPLSL